MTKPLTDEELIKEARDQARCIRLVTDDIVDALCDRLETANRDKAEITRLFDSLYDSVIDCDCNSEDWSAIKNLLSKKE